ncbi:MAG: PH domain-containing protein [Planctomycetes bacterium]|nr:PH domain-containing protein [Planctomycetota bacterium]
MIESLKEFARSRILKLPVGNPPIPHGDPTKVETWNPDEAYLRYRLLGFFLGGIPAALMSLALAVSGVLLMASPETLASFSREAEREIAKGSPAGLAVAGFFILVVGLFITGSLAFQYVVLHLELDMLRYTLTDQAIRLRRGVVHVEEVTLSYANIQNVKFSQGPVQRYFGIGDLIVETAGGGGGAIPQPGAPQVLHHQGLIKGITNPETLRDLIQARVRRFKGSGLGGDVQDAEAAPEAASASADFSSPEATALLGEIRDALAATRLAG